MALLTKLTYRICPGRHSAQAGLFIHIASVLHVFDIGPPKDEHGKPIHVKYEMTDGILSYVLKSAEVYVISHTCA